MNTLGLLFWYLVYTLIRSFILSILGVEFGKTSHAIIRRNLVATKALSSDGDVSVNSSGSIQRYSSYTD